jgi:Pre-toxin TG
MNSNVRQPRWVASCLSVAYALGLSFAAATVLPGWARANCDPTAGDETYAWVSNRAAGLSQSLAKADYDARTFNYLLTGFDDVQARQSAVNAELEALEAHMQSAEQAAQDTNPNVAVQNAIARERDSQSLLNDLFKVRGDLDELERRHQSLTISPTLYDFQTLGLQTVGRETMLASFQDLGDDAAKTLNLKYSVSVSVTFNEDGDFQNAQFMSNSGMADTVALAIASYFGPAGYAVFAVGEVAKFGVESAECNEKIDHQKERLRDAFRLLPEKLIVNRDQFALYTKLYNANFMLFSNQSKEIGTLEHALDTRWAELYAYNAARNAAAHAVLTPAKVALVAKQYGHDDHITNMFDNATLAELAANVGQLNSYVADNESKLILSCGSVEGFENAERQADALKYAEDAYHSMDNVANFAPLRELLQVSVSELAAVRSEADQSRLQLRARSCKQHNPPIATHAMENGRKLALTLKSKLTLTVKRTRTLNALHLLDRTRTEMVDHAFVLQNMAAADFLHDMCSMFTRDGHVYRCDTSGDPGQSYRKQFGDSTGDSRTDVLEGPNDGGYARDNRAVAADVAHVDQNLNGRISQLQQRVTDVRNELPQWTTQNGAAVAQLVQTTAAAEHVDQGDRVAFETKVGPSIAGAKATLDSFLQSPLDKTNIARVIQSIGGTDFSLPDVPADALAPDAPQIAGFTAIDRAYGSETDSVVRAILRERRKAERDLTTSAVALNDSTDLLDMAQRFVRQGSPSGRAVASALVRDSESLRYAQASELPDPELTYFDPSGTLKREAAHDLSSPPPESLLARGRAFRASQTAFAGEYDTLRSALTDGSPETQRRLDIASVAQRIADTASSTFYSGDVSNGERLLHVAHSVLDVASRFVPGINLGRDAYEAISGKDLFTGEELGPLARVGAVLGMVTLGFEDDIEGGIQAVRKIAELGVPAERAEEIVAASRNMKSGMLKIDPHAEAAMLEEPLGVIDRSEVNDAIDRGTHFWDRQENSLVAYENNVALNEVRVGVAIDIDRKVVSTAFREVRDDATLSNTLWDGRPRFIQLPAKE